MTLKEYSVESSVAYSFADSIEKWDEGSRQFQCQCARNSIRCEYYI